MFMLRPARMQKIRLVAIRSVSRPLLSELHRLGMVEIRRFESEGFETGKPVELYDRISTALVRIRSIKSVLGLSKSSAPEAEMDAEKALSAAEGFPFDEGLRARHSLLEKNESEIAALRSRLSDAKKLSSFKVDFSSLDSPSLSFSVGSLPQQKAEALKSALSGYKAEFHDSGNEAVFAVAYPAGDAEIESILAKHGASMIDTEGVSTPQKTISEFTSRISELQEESGEASKEISRAAAMQGEELLRIEGALSLWADRSLITKEMGIGGQTIILEGWMKEKDLPSLQNTLETKFGEKTFMEEIPSNDEPPVVLDNPESTYPFQFLVELFSLPKATELDPTLILLITVPIIYGMMLGDVFYGIISFLLASWMLGKVQKGGLGYGVASLWRFSSIAGIVFGLIFDEWLGMSSYHLLQVFGEWGLLNLTAMGITGPLYAGFSRSHQVPLLLGVSILLGLVHLAFGFLLGAINEWNHNRKHAIGKLAWIFIEIGGAITVASLMLSMLPAEIGFFGLGLLILSILVMAATEGPIGLIELPGLIGNVLSYARIAAVGLVGVLLAELINEMFIPTPEAGLFYAIIMIPILLLFHVLNIGLAMVECLVQGGRLNLVEFYSKFFKGGGREFTPFMMGVKPK
jgi:V/A-type H+-transporting ATPase subunit I